MPLYAVIMWTYNLMSAYIIVVLLYNLFKEKSVWQQSIAFFVIFPFVLRVLMIK
jgi:hypothetical protein